MTPLNPTYLPLEDPSIFATPVFWIASALSIAVVVALAIILRKINKRFAERDGRDVSDTKNFLLSNTVGIDFSFMAAAIALGVLGTSVAVSSVPAYASNYAKTNDNVKTKYLISNTYVEVPRGIDDFTVDPATGDTLTQIEATVISNGKAVSVPYHVTINKDSGEPTLTAVDDSGAGPISPESLLRK
jgi:hypothetical protein